MSYFARRYYTASNRSESACGEGEVQGLPGRTRIDIQLLADVPSATAGSTTNDCPR